MAVSLGKIQRWEKKKNSKKIINALNDTDHETRINAIQALSSFNSHDVINQLVNLLRETDPEIRLTSIQALEKIGSSRSIEFIRFMLEKEEDGKIIEAAKQSLVTIRENAELEENA